MKNLILDIGLKNTQGITLTERWSFSLSLTSVVRQE